MNSYIDLHTHSNKSDGTDSPSELACIAAKSGLCAIALTDHDTVEGIDEAVKASKPLGIELVPGIEFSVKYFAELHILGLYIDYNDEELRRILGFLAETRKSRNEQIAERLRELGLDIKTSELPEADRSAVTRAHFAKLLVEKGYCSSKSDAYNRYLGFGAPAYVPRERLTVQECISVIHRAGGVAVLAHLNQIMLEEDMTLIKLLSDLKDMGLDGIEAMYSEYDNKFSQKCIGYANIYDFIITGGSDYHGDNKDNLIGVVNENEKVPVKLLNKIKKYRKGE